VQPILERLEPALDVVALSAGHHDVLQSEPPRRPLVPGTTIGDKHEIALIVPQGSPQESENIDRFSVFRDVQVHHFSVFGVYCSENEDPAT